MYLLAYQCDNIAQVPHVPVIMFMIMKIMLGSTLDEELEEKNLHWMAILSICKKDKEMYLISLLTTNSIIIRSWLTEPGLDCMV